MKFALTPLFLAALLAAGEARAINCARDTTGLIPLIDLGMGLYLGSQGGLYSGGTNQRPPAHSQAGLGMAQAMVALDTLGLPDPVHGRIVLISIGMSNTTQEFSKFVPLATADPQKNPAVVVIDCALGGQSADLIRNPSAAYWDTVAARLRGHGSSPRQAQVVWLKEADKSPSGGWPAATDTLTWNLGTVVRILKSRCPNIRLAYLSSRIYAGYATTALNPEPYSYQSGFAVKRIVDAQIQGADSLNYDPSRGPVLAPWMSWGPYLWADGLKARADGLTWRCDEYQSDGTHPNAAGQQVVADTLLAFFKRDSTTTPWFLATAVRVDAPPIRHSVLAIHPNPARGSLRIAYTFRETGKWKLEVLDGAGRHVRALASGDGELALGNFRWDGRTDKGARAPSGIYWVRESRNGSGAARKFAWLGGD